MAKRWTQGDIIYLMVNYMSKGIDNCVHYLGRTYAAVTSKYYSEKKSPTVKFSPTNLLVTILDPADDGFVEIGETFTLQASVTDVSNPSLPVPQHVVWSSDSASVKVDPVTGFCEVVGAGTINISAASVLDPTKVDSTSISVTVVAYLKLVSVEAPPSINVKVGIPFTFPVRSTFVNGFSPLKCTNNTRVSIGANTKMGSGGYNPINTFETPVSITVTEAGESTIELFVNISDRIFTVKVIAV